ncbi:MAG TPA: VOC family protein [Acidobacteriota bacterium]|nr:VOC family protein [Acidobacteriota bacterium]
MKILRSTPVLVVDKIEPSLPFWVDRLGYLKQVEVPHGDNLGFVILEKDGLEVMLQTRESVEADLPAIKSYVRGNAITQFIEVDSLDDVLKKLEGYDLLTPVRTTFYGMREAILADPNGYVLVFAEKLNE